jgi:ClpP class serine protease
VSNLVLRAVSDTPWAITESGMRQVLFVVSRGELYKDDGRAALAARQGKPLDNTRTVTMRDRIAIVPVEGVLCRKAPWFAEVSGATSYEIMRRDIQQALDNPNVDAIMLNVHSPGGEADGCHELASFIAEARAQKPIWSYCALAASGGLWIAVAADRVIVPPAAFMGSIGVRQTIIDYSQLDKSMGVREIELVSTQSPDKRGTPIDDELLGRYQSHIDDLAQIFVDFVADCRGTDAEDVIANYGKGDVMIGAKAVACGMADELGFFEDALANLAAHVGEQEIGAAFTRATASQKRTIKMTTKKPDLLAAAAASTPTIAAAPGDKMCASCGKETASYCKSCFDDAAPDDDEDEDEEEAKALGLEPKASRSARLQRMGALAAFEGAVIKATGAETSELAAAAVTKVVGEVAGMRADHNRRELRATLESGFNDKRLTLGAIKTKVPVALRGEAKAAWSKAMSALATTTKETVLDAACSIDVGAENLAAVAEFVKTSEPIAAETFIEPARDPEAESASLDETNRKIDAAVKRTKAVMDRGTAKPAKNTK